MVSESTRGSNTSNSFASEIPTASKEMHKASSDFTESRKSVILAICSKLSGFTKCLESVKTGEAVLYFVLPVLVFINCLSVYPEKCGSP